MKWFLLALSKYGVFTGRSRRKEYWYFLLFFTLISIVLTVFDFPLGTYSGRYNAGLLTSIFTIATFVPWVALSVRRLHDIGYSGRWLWVMLAALVAGILDAGAGVAVALILSVVFCVAAVMAIQGLTVMGHRQSNEVACSLPGRYGLSSVSAEAVDLPSWSARRASRRTARPRRYPAHAGVAPGAFSTHPTSRLVLLS
jgi:uncharacterized membrane protein YhaH (DUF805 family)